MKFYRGELHSILTEKLKESFLIYMRGHRAAKNHNENVFFNLPSSGGLKEKKMLIAI